MVYLQTELHESKVKTVWLIGRKDEGGKMGLIYAIVFGAVLLAAMVLGIVLSIILRKSDSIELVQGKLENTDSSIAKAIDYLEVTNKWSK